MEYSERVEDEEWGKDITSGFAPRVVHPCTHRHRHRHLSGMSENDWENNEDERNRTVNREMTRGNRGSFSVKPSVVISGLHRSNAEISREFVQEMSGWWVRWGFIRLLWWVLWNGKRDKCSSDARVLRRKETERREFRISERSKIN